MYLYTIDEKNLCLMSQEVVEAIWLMSREIPVDLEFPETIFQKALRAFGGEGARQIVPSTTVIQGWFIVEKKRCRYWEWVRKVFVLFGKKAEYECSIDYYKRAILSATPLSTTEFNGAAKAAPISPQTTGQVLSELFARISFDRSALLNLEATFAEKLLAVK